MWIALLIWSYWQCRLYLCTAKAFNSVQLHWLIWFFTVCKSYLSKVFRQTGLSKQCRPRWDAAECGIWSGSALFATHPTCRHIQLQCKYGEEWILSYWQTRIKACAISVDPDEMACNEPSHQDLHCHAGFYYVSPPPTERRNCFCLGCLSVHPSVCQKNCDCSITWKAFKMFSWNFIEIKSIIRQLVDHKNHNSCQYIFGLFPFEIWQWPFPVHSITWKPFKIFSWNFIEI